MEVEAPRRRLSYPRFLGMNPKANISVLFIMLYELINGFAYCSLTANVAPYASDHLGLPDSTTLIISLVFSGVGYTMPIIGGLIGDIKLGRYWTIFAGNCFYLFGMVIMMLITGMTEAHVVLQNELKVILYLVGLVLVAIGQGVITVQILPLGAEQIKERGLGTIQRFYRWSTFAFNLGKLLAYLPLSYILRTVNADDAWVPCAIQLAAMCLAAFLFLLGKRWYQLSPAQGYQRFKQMLIAVKQCALLRPRQPMPDENADRRVWEHWYTAYMIRPIVFIIAIFSIGSVFEAIYFQMFATYPLQAQNLTDGGLNLPGNFMVSFDPLPVMVIVPAIEIYCLYLKRQHEPHIVMHPLERIGIGLICAALSATAAGIMSSILKSHNAQDISIFWQIPQYAALGVSEVIFFASGFEFCFTEAPKGLEGFASGMFLGVGSFFGFLLYLVFIPLGTTATSSGVPHNLLEALFYTLAGLMVLFLGPYVLLVKRYRATREEMPKEPNWKALPSITLFRDSLTSYDEDA